MKADPPRRYLCTNATTRRRCYVLASGKGRHAVVTLTDGTRLKRLDKGVYEGPDGTRYGAERDEAP